MSVLTEGDLQITLPAGASGRKLDDKSSHGLSHCMKAVDFIVELDEKIFFIELKDPDRPDAPPERSAKFMGRFLSGEIDDNLKTKYRDSWLYEWAQGRIEKPVIYLVLIGASSLSAPELLARTEALKRQLPVSGPKGLAWKNPLVAGCAVMNLAAWNKALPHMQVRRISAAT